MNRFLYAVHKWISAIAFVQLAIWTTTGFVFSCVSQDAMKGGKVDGAHRAPIESAPPISIERAIEAATAEIGTPDRVELRGTPSGPYYFAGGPGGSVRIDARTGEVAPVSRDEAAAIARRDQPGAPSVRAASLVEASPPIEYRDCEPADCTLPAYRVELADGAGTVLYVDRATGEVTARRNDLWRTYDFLWSLHIMDYKGRENFNHVWIRGAALLAMSTVLSGLVILTIRAVRWTRRRLARS